MGGHLITSAVFPRIKKKKQVIGSVVVVLRN